MNLKNKKYKKELEKTLALMEAINYDTFKVSELGNNWSDDYYLNKRQGKLPYIKKNYEFILVDDYKTIPKNAVYLTEEQVAEINEAAFDVQLAIDTYNKILNDII